MDKSKLKKLIEVSRYKPVIGAEQLLNLELPAYQRDMLRRIWNHKNVILLCSRRTGKTFISGVALTLKAMLYPQTKIGIVAPVFRQAQTVFREIENIYNEESMFFRFMCKDEPKHRSAEWRLDLKNGSVISALPFSDHVRSKGFNIILIDEYGFGDNMNNKVKRILAPMLFTKREAKIKNTHKTDIGNQMIISSTATFKWNDYYKKVQKYKEKINEGSEEYDIISYDYRDGLDSGIFEKDRVLEEYENADSLTRQMEYLNIFPDETGGFITYKLLDEKAFDKSEKLDVEKGEYKPPETQVELEQTEFDRNGYPKNKYILAIDDADQGRDNFALAVIKLDGKIKRLVRLETISKGMVQDKIKLIREILRKFNIIRIVADQRHKSIKDGLAEPYKYADGKEGAIIADIDDEEQQERIRRDHGPNCNMRELIKIHSFTNKTNEERARHFLAEVEHGRFKIPVDPAGGYESKEEEDIYNEIKEAIAEITSIRPKSSGRYTKYEPEGTTQKKDRWTVCELGCYMADEYLKDEMDDTDDIVIGV